MTSWSYYFFRKDIPSAQDPRRIEGSLQRRHLAQMFFAVKLAQVIALQFSEAVLGRDCAADRNCALDECQINLPGPCGFVIVARQDVHVHVIVADVTEDREA